MAIVSDLTTTPLSGLNHIDALLDIGPDWNYMLQGGNTIKYTFSIASGNEEGKSGQVAFSANQQAATRGAIAYLAEITGIEFVETTVGTDAQIHLANFDLVSPTTTGLCSWKAPYMYDKTTDRVTSFAPQAWVYLDNVEWRGQNENLTPGGYGYQTLLHELGHALGLKHSFDDEHNPVTLPKDQDNTSLTLMSYSYQGGPYSTYRVDDIAAFDWLYGRDGLGGALGINSTTGGRYVTGAGGNDALTGTAANDTLKGGAGNDTLDGGAGTDTAVFSGERSNYVFSELAGGGLQVTDKTGNDGMDILSSIELFQFAPSAPTLTVSKNANGYALGNTPIVTGGAQADATVTLYDANNNKLGTVKAGADGLWSFTLPMLQDGTNYGVSATATDAAGNVSSSSAIVRFNIDAHAPGTPTAQIALNNGANQATVSGTGDAGTQIMLVRTSDLTDIAATTVGSDGKWSLTTSPLPNGTYGVRAVSIDKADNATSANGLLNFTVSSTANVAGTNGNDTLAPMAGNNAISGGAGIDTVVVNDVRADYLIAREVWGFGLSERVGTGGHDSLIDVERVKFTDASVALDVDGVAGQAYRLYQAAFDRPAEASGLGYWIWRMDNGATQQQVAAEFLNQPETRALYGDNPTNAEFVSRLYTNVLHREAEGAGFQYWMDAIEKNNVPRAQVLAYFSESPENQAQVVGTIEDGIVYTPWVA